MAYTELREPQRTETNENQPNYYTAASAVNKWDQFRTDSRTI